MTTWCIWVYHRTASMKLLLTCSVEAPEKSYQDYCWTQAKVDTVCIFCCRKNKKCFGSCWRHLERDSFDNTAVVVTGKGRGKALCVRSQHCWKCSFMPQDLPAFSKYNTKRWCLYHRFCPDHLYPTLHLQTFASSQSCSRLSGICVKNQVMHLNSQQVITITVATAFRNTFIYECEEQHVSASLS